MIAGRGWAKRILEVQWATRRVLAWHAVFGRCSCRAAQVLDVQRAAACAISAETRSLRVDGQGARVLSWARERQGVCARQGAHRPSIDRVEGEHSARTSALCPGQSTRSGNQRCLRALMMVKRNERADLAATVRPTAHVLGPSESRDGNRWSQDQPPSRDRPQLS